MPLREPGLQISAPWVSFVRSLEPVPPLNQEELVSQEEKQPDSSLLMSPNYFWLSNPLIYSKFFYVGAIGVILPNNREK